MCSSDMSGPSTGWKITLINLKKDTDLTSFPVKSYSGHLKEENKRCDPTSFQLFLPPKYDTPTGNRKRASTRTMKAKPN